jgi:hypothetical protein
MFNRRHFNLGLTSLAFAGLGSCTTTPRGAAAQPLKATVRSSVIRRGCSICRRALRTG